MYIYLYRSFNDSSQYPIFPWVLIKYHETCVEIEDKDNILN
jgi:hypothetical protein